MAAYKDMTFFNDKSPPHNVDVLTNVKQVVGRDDLASRLIASRSCSSTTCVASYTKLSSPKRDKRKKRT